MVGTLCNPIVTFWWLISDEAAIERCFIGDQPPISCRVVSKQIIRCWVCDTSLTCLRIIASFCHKNSKRTHQGFVSMVCRAGKKTKESSIQTETRLKATDVVNMGCYARARAYITCVVGLIRTKIGILKHLAFMVTLFWKATLVWKVPSFSREVTLWIFKCLF